MAVFFGVLVLLRNKQCNIVKQIKKSNCFYIGEKSSNLADFFGYQFLGIFAGCKGIHLQVFKTWKVC
jgi:hypothetical protein